MNFASLSTHENQHNRNGGSMTATLDLNLDELRLLTNLLADDEQTRNTPIADKIRLAFFDLDNALSAAGLPPYDYEQPKSKGNTVRT